MSRQQPRDAGANRPGTRAWALGLLAGTGLLLSAGGLISVTQHEGLVHHAYPDPATGGAPWTICYGHTGRDVRPGMTATQAQCDAWLVADLRIAENAVKRHVRVPMRQGQIDAYTSFVFNAGEGNFRSSTMLRLLNAGDWVGSCRQFPRWKYANKKELRGLVIRRYEEQTTCLTGGPYVYYPNGRTAAKDSHVP